MREILFRGKTTGKDEHKKGEWVYGNVIFMERGNGKKDAVIFPPNSEIAHGDIWGEFWWVDPETVGQYIGLSDKHGRLIFEGDIMKTRRIETYRRELKGYYGYDSDGYPKKLPGYTGSMYVVDKRTNDDYHAVVERGRDGSYFLSGADVAVDAICNEIVGNIHDNPELLG